MGFFGFGEGSFVGLDVLGCMGFCRLVGFGKMVLWVCGFGVWEDGKMKEDK